VRDDATGRRVARIVEVEAYLGPEDLASHARFGRTARNAVMFGSAGIAYVYLVYGMYDCLNVVTEEYRMAGAVLIRAAEPLEGIEAMRRDRHAVQGRRRVVREASEAARAAAAQRLARVPVARLASGPGLVAAAFGLDRGWTGTDLCDPASPVRLEPVPAADAVPDERVRMTARIGVGYAGPDWAERPLRFAVGGHPSVSGPAAAR
jgi:DNA-3-methyladenine glycosylase